MDNTRATPHTPAIAARTSPAPLPLIGKDLPSTQQEATDFHTLYRMWNENTYYYGIIHDQQNLIRVDLIQMQILKKKKQRISSNSESFRKTADKVKILVTHTPV